VLNTLTAIFQVLTACAGH